MVARCKLPLDIEELEEGGYLGICPVLPGCHAEGETISEVIENIQEAARLVIEFRLEQGLGLPKGLVESDVPGVLHSEVLVAVPLQSYNPTPRLKMFDHRPMEVPRLLDK